MNCTRKRTKKKNETKKDHGFDYNKESEKNPKTKERHVFSIERSCAVCMYARTIIQEEEKYSLFLRKKKK